MPIIVSSHITASGHITGSVTSTGSFGRLIASTFSGDGSGLSSVTAGSVTWANISSKPTVVSASAQIKDEISGSFTDVSSSFSTRIKANEDIVKGKTILSQSAQIKTEISGAFTTTSSSLAGRISTNEGYLNQSVKTTASPTFASLTTTGDITAQNYIVSSSVTYMTSSFSSGSTIFGDDSDDTHKFTGSLLVTGSFKVASGNAEFAGNVSGSSTSTGSFGLGHIGTYTGFTHDALVIPKYGRIQLSGINGVPDTQTFIYGAGADLQLYVSGKAYVRLNDEGFTVNEDSYDHDFRVESNANTHALFVDAGTSYVGINTTLPSKALDVTGDIRASGDISGSSTSTGSFGRIETAGNINADGRIYENNSSVIDHATAMAIVFGG